MKCKLADIERMVDTMEVLNLVIMKCKLADIERMVDTMEVLNLVIMKCKFFINYFVPSITISFEFSHNEM